MKSTAKAVALLRDLADRLKLRLPTYTVRPQNDANGWPMLFLSPAGTETEGSAVLAMRIMAVNAVSQDVFGNSLIAFAPHTFEVAYELDTNGKPIPANKDVLIVEREAVLTGVKVQLKEIANGTAVTETSINAAAIVIELEDLQFPTKGV